MGDEKKNSRGKGVMKEKTFRKAGENAYNVNPHASSALLWS